MSIDFASGSIIDNQYEVLETLGEGGTGTVLKVREIELGRIVAVKMLHPYLMSDDTCSARFTREGKILSLLEHPNLLTFYRFGFHKQTAYIAMEYLPGETLRTRLNREGKLTVEHSLELAVQVCSALDYTHGRGIIHRDVTPMNIMINDVHHVKIVDFGLSRLLTAEVVSQTLTQTGTVLGSVYFMSPEQCLGLKVDCRSDVYSVGCLLFQMMCGCPPFDAENPLAIMHKHATVSPPAITGYLNKNEVPEGLETVLANALAKEPLDRYQSMREFEEDLNLVRSGRGGLCKPRSAGSDLRAHAKRAPYLMLACIGCICAAIVWIAIYGRTSINGTTRLPKLQAGQTVAPGVLDSALLRPEQTVSWSGRTRIEYYRKWLMNRGKKATPERAMALLYLSKALIGNHEYEPSREALAAADALIFTLVTLDLETGEVRPAVLQGIIDCSSSMSDLEGMAALERFLNLISSKAPTNMELCRILICNRLSVFYLRTGMYGKALKTLENNSTVRSLLRTSVCFRHLGNRTQAHKALTEARKTQQPEFLLALACEFQKNNDLVEALHIAREFPLSAKSRLNSTRVEAGILAQSGRNNQACDLLLSTIKPTIKERLSMLRLLHLAVQLSSKVDEPRREKIYEAVCRELGATEVYKAPEWLFLDRIVNEFIEHGKLDRNRIKEMQEAMASSRPQELDDHEVPGLRQTLVNNRWQWWVNGDILFHADGTAYQGNSALEFPHGFEDSSHCDGDRGLWWLHGRTLRIMWSGCPRYESTGYEELLVALDGKTIYQDNPPDPTNCTWARVTSP